MSIPILDFKKSTSHNNINQLFFLKVLTLLKKKKGWESSGLMMHVRTVTELPGNFIQPELHQEMYCRDGVTVSLNSLLFRSH